MQQGHKFLFFFSAITMVTMLVVNLNRELLPHITQKFIAVIRPPSPKVATWPQYPCYASPFVNCDNASVPVVLSNYTKKYGELQKVRVDLDFNNLPPGITAYRHDKPVVERKDRYKVGLLNPRSHYHTLNFMDCEFSNCDFVKTNIDETTDAVVVVGPEINPKTPRPPRTPKQLYMMVAYEPPWYFPWGLLRGVNSLTSAFNLTASYNLDADIPVSFGWLKYVQPEESFQDLVVVAEQKKRKIVWIVSDCEPESRRQDYVKELKKYIDVDVFGKCGSPCPKQPDLCGQDMREYRFYLAFENSYCKDYVTEKFFKVFSTRYVIPVVRGEAQYDQLYPPGTFINTDNFQSPRHLAQHLNYLIENPHKFAEILERKVAYREMNRLDRTLSHHCHLCKFLNKRDVRVIRYYKDIREYVGGCRKPTDLSFLS